MIPPLLVSFQVGIAAGATPSILPILPVVLAGWVALVAHETHPISARRWRLEIVLSRLVQSWNCRLQPSRITEFRERRVARYLEDLHPRH